MEQPEIEIIKRAFIERGVDLEGLTDEQVMYLYDHSTEGALTQIYIALEPWREEMNRWSKKLNKILSKLCQ